MIPGSHKVADAVAALALPANVAIWTLMNELDILLRILVSAGSLVLIVIAVRSKMKQGKRKEK